jgi:hypothetical protein
MIDDLVHNPTLALRVILGDAAIREMPPHERIRFKIAWVSAFTLDTSGFSTAKTFSIAALAALRLILLDPGRVQGVASKTFGQGQLVGEMWDQWLELSPVFASQIKRRYKTSGAGGLYDFDHAATGWVLRARNGSVARIIPPGLMKGADRMASERFSDGYFDEIHKWPDDMAIEKTMVARTTKPVHDPRHPIYQNHVWLSSTAEFKYKQCYQRVLRYMANMAAGNTDYAFMTFNFRDVPDKPEFHALVNLKALKELEDALPASVFACEGLGEWVDDSEGFYKSSEIDALRRLDVQECEKRRWDTEIFVCGIDVAHGGAKGGGDDSSLQVIRHHKGITSHAWAEEMHGVRLEQISARVHELNQRYHFNLLCMDPGGGGLFLRDYLVNDKQLIAGAETEVLPIATVEDERVVEAQRNLVLFARGTPEISNAETGAFGKTYSDSGLVNRMHYAFLNTVEKQLFCIPVDLRYESPEAITRLAKQTRLRLCREVMDRTYTELVGIETEKDASGTPKRDAFGMLRFVASHGKKDRAYALLYAWVAMMIIWKQIEFDKSDQGIGVVTVTEMDAYGTGTGILPDSDDNDDVPGFLSIHNIPLA